MNPWHLAWIIPVTIIATAVATFLVLDWFIVIYYGEWWRKK
jgi:hypothetical protein